MAGAQNPDIREGMSREEIDAAIARHADTEVLVDQPYVDNKKVRVTGRFTVESLSPHRVLDEERPPPTATESAAADEAAGRGSCRPSSTTCARQASTTPSRARTSASTASTCSPE